MEAIRSRSWTLARRRVAVAVASLLVAVGSLAAVPSDPVDAQTGPQAGPAIGVIKHAPSEVLYGDTSPVEVAVENADDAGWAYNVSLRDVLPPGISYAGPLSGAPAPQILVDQPEPGFTTLLWVNVADVAPGNTYVLAYEVAHTTTQAGSCSAAVRCVGDTYVNTVDAYVHTNPRYVPSFDAVTGVSDDERDGLVSASDSAASRLVPFVVEKDEPSPEGEILRGIHDHPTTYSITVRNNLVNPTTGLTLRDYLPAELEFLVCGGVDHTTSAPTHPDREAFEYPGAPSLTTTPAVGPDCLEPHSVDTQLGSTFGHAELEPGDVFTELVWEDVADLAPGQSFTLRYAAGIPIRANTLTWGEESEDPENHLWQGANLDNNSGREIRDEDPIVNRVMATGTYQGPVSVGAPFTTVWETLHRTAEDLRILKDVDDETIAHGAVTTWTLTIDTSEYRAVSNLVVTDTLPNGLCPVGADPSCSGDAPTIRYGANPPQHLAYSAGTSRIPAGADAGGWNLVFHVDPLAPSTTAVLTFHAEVRTHYQDGDGNDTFPVVARDAWSNRVGVTGDQHVLLVEDAPIDHDPDYGDGVEIPDVSAAAQVAPSNAILKQIARPVLDGDQWVCPGDGAAWGPHEPELVFTHGDLVCYRLTVPFSGMVDTRDPLIRDILPPNTHYVAGSTAPTAANSVALVDGGQPFAEGGESESGPVSLVWRPGTVDDSDSGVTCPSDPAAGDTCFVAAGQQFDVTFMVVVEDDPRVGNDFDLVQNLMKYRSANSAEEFSADRADVGFTLVRPVVELSKSNDAAGPLVQGDTVTYTITVANTGHHPARNVVVWDLVPAQLTCADLELDPDATCEDGAVAGSSRLTWTIDELGAEDEAQLVYTATLPSGEGGVAAGEVLTNRAGVVRYESHPEHPVDPGDPAIVELLPCENVDASVPAGDCNAPRADDTTTVTVVDATIAKARTTSLTQTGNAEADQATIGELIRYTVTFTLPAHTSVYDARFEDVIPSRLHLVDGDDDRFDASIVDPAVTLTVGGSPVTPPWFDEVGTGLAWTTGPGTGPGSPNLTLTFPEEYQTGDDDHVFEVTYWVYVADGGSAPVRGNTLTNTAALRWRDLLGNQVSRTASIGSVVVEPDLRVTKANDADPAPVRGGDEVTYTLLVENRTGSRVSTANDLVVTDTIPLGLTALPPVPVEDDDEPYTVTVTGDGFPGHPFVITWTFDDGYTIEPGASVELAYTLTVDDAVVAGVDYTNEVVAETWSLPIDHRGQSNQGRRYTAESESTVRATTPGLTKSADPTQRTIGEVVDYTITFTLPANVDLFDLTVIDLVDEGLAVVESTLECDDGVAAICPDAEVVSSVAGGTRIVWFFDDIGVAPEPREVTLTYQAVVLGLVDDAAVIAGDSLPNTVGLWWNAADRIPDPEEVPDDPGEFDVTGPEGSATVDVVEPRLTVDKQVNGTDGSPVPYGFEHDETLTYTVRVTNTGTSPAYDLVVVDELPTGVPLTFTLEPLTCGADVPARCDDVLQEVEPGPGGPVSITWSIPGPLDPGDSVTFTYAAEISDPALVEIGDVYRNTVGISEYHGTPGDERGDDECGRYRCYGTAHPDDPTPASSYEDEVAVTPALAADVSITKAVVDPGTLVELTGEELTFEVGETVTYLLTVTNHGPTIARGPIVVDDPLTTGLALSGITTTSEGWDCDPDAARCTHPGPLEVGDSATFVVTATITPDADHQLTNTATVAHDTDEPCEDQDDTCAGNDSDDATIDVVAVADLGITKGRTGEDPWYVGGAGTYEIVVTNHGPSTSVASGDAPIVVTDVLADGLTYTGFDGEGWECALDEPTNTVTCEYQGDPLTVGASTTLLIHVDIDEDAPFAAAGAPVTNRATVAPGETPEPSRCADDPEGDDACAPNTDQHVEPILPSADLSVDKELIGTGELVIGSPAIYRITVTNHGPSTAEGITISDVLPEGLTFQGVSGTGWTCGTDGVDPQVVNCEHAFDLARGESTVLHLEVLVDLDAFELVGDEPDPELVNSVSVSADTHDPNPDNDDDEEPAPLLEAVDLEIEKTADPAIVVEGGEVTFTITVTNHGPSTTRGTTTVTDELPEGLVLTGVTGSGWVCNPDPAVDGEVEGPATIVCTSTSSVEAGDAFPDLVLTARVTGAARPEATNVVTVDPPVDQRDPNPSNDDDEAKVVVPAPGSPALFIDKSADQHRVHTGDLVTWTVAVRNRGDAASGSVRVVDTLPEGLELVSTGTPAPSVSGRVLTWDVGPLPAGSSAVLTYVTRVTAEPGVSLTNGVVLNGRDVDHDTVVVEDDPDTGGPATSPSTTIPGVGSEPGGRGPLPFTGAAVGGLVLLGLLSGAVGTVFTAIGRRRRN